MAEGESLVFAGLGVVDVSFIGALQKVYDTMLLERTGLKILRLTLAARCNEPRDGISNDATDQQTSMVERSQCCQLLK